MLPASYQAPAALVLLAGGALACFAGYRVFRIVLGIYGFIIGALLTTSLMGAEQTAWTLLAAIGGGLAGALVLVLAYFFGVALLGAGLGAFASHLVAAAFDREPHVFVVALFAISGGLAALALQRYVIIGATGFAGAWTAIVGAFALSGSRVAAESARPDVWTPYPLDPAPGQTWVILVWILLALAGVAVQLRSSPKKKN